MKQMKWLLMTALMVMLLGCTGQQSRILNTAEALALSYPDSASTLLSQIDTATLSEDGRMRYDLTRALVHEEQCQLRHADSTSFLSADSTTWSFHRMAVYRSADEKALLADSALLHIYHYYERASLGGTADDREALQRFGRICLVLSRHHSEKANTDRFLHLAIHCAEAAEDHALAYRAYSLLGLHSKDVMQLLCLTRALGHYRYSPDHTRELLTLLNDYGNAVLQNGPFDLHNFPSLERTAALVARHEEAMPSPVMCDSVFQCLDSLWALPAPNNVYTYAYTYSDDAPQQILEISVPVDMYEEARQGINAKGEKKHNPDFKSSWQNAVNAFNTSQDTYLAAGYVMKTTSLQRHLLTAAIVILLLSLLLLALFFRNWHIKTRQRQEAERIAHQHETEQLAERLRQKDTMITMLRGHIMDKSEILDMLEPTAGKRTIINARNWQEIEMTLDTADDQFVSRLRRDHPDFSEDDIRLCMLSRLKLSNTALSAIYVISVSAVQHRKQRLKRDGFGVTDSNVTFDQVIANF